MVVIVVIPTDGLVYMVEVVFFRYLFCFCHFFCMFIVASRLLGAMLAFSSDGGTPIVAWVSQSCNPHACIDFKKIRYARARSDCVNEFASPQSH